MADVLTDADGFAIPPLWRDSPKWIKLAVPVRAKFAREYLEQLERDKNKPPKRQVRRVYATRFTTQYAVEWGRAKGWKVIDRERFDARTSRHHDLMLGLDVLFDTPNGMVGVQGAGQYERAAHYETFVARGGIEKATRRKVGVIYLEFVRGQKTPIKEERWA